MMFLNLSFAFSGNYHLIKTGIYDCYMVITVTEKFIYFYLYLGIYSIGAKSGFHYALSIFTANFFFKL